MLKTCLKTLFWNASTFYKLSEKSSNRRCSMKIGILKNLVKLTGKRLCWSLFLIKLQDFSPTILLKRDSSTGVFLWNFRKKKKNLFEEHLRMTISESWFVNDSELKAKLNSTNLLQTANSWYYVIIVLSFRCKRKSSLFQTHLMTWRLQLSNNDLKNLMLRWKPESM